MSEEIKYKIDHKLRRADSLVHDVHEYDLNLFSNHIFLMGVDRGYDVTEDSSEPGVDFAMANRFIRNMNVCMRVNPDKPIVIHMKTCGGIWEEGMAMYDMIKSCPVPVTILNYTHARSMSSIIFQAANKRVMMPHSHFMFHNGTYSIEGTTKMVESNIEFSKKATTAMVEIYADSMSRSGSLSGRNKAHIRKWIKSQMDKKEDVFLTAEETVSHGFADEIFNYDWSKLSEYTKDQLSR